MKKQSILQGSIPTYSAAETRQFLTQHTWVDDELMHELWNTSSRLPGLLDARPAGSVPRAVRKGDLDFIYNPATERYTRVASDRAVSERELRMAVYRVSNEAKNRIRTETQQMMAGTIFFALWYDRTRSILKALFRAVWLVTWGGILFEDDSSRNAFYLWCILLFDRLDQFKIAIETGAIEWNGHIVSHAGRLARGGNPAYQNVKLEVGRKKGHTEGRRVLGENENHCHDSEDILSGGVRSGCVELSELGWMPIHRVTPLGLATCRDNCLCRIETRKRI